MTVRLERSIDIDASPEAVWEFIADPAKRAGAISVVSSYELKDDDGRVAIWHVSLPLPLIDRTVSIRTEETDRDPPRYVRFVGQSPALDVIGEHRIEATADGSRLYNTFTVDGALPGVERYFKHNLDTELENLERALRRSLQ